MTNPVRIRMLLRKGAGLPCGAPSKPRTVYLRCPASWEKRSSPGNRLWSRSDERPETAGRFLDDFPPSTSFIDVMTPVGPSSSASVTFVAPVAAVHEEMEDRAQKEDRPGEDAPDGHPGLLPEEERCGRPEPS